MNDQNQNNTQIIDILNDQTLHYPQKDFLRFRNKILTYEKFSELYLDYASKLNYLNIKKGQIVPTIFPNNHSPIGIWFALMYLGGVWTPINTEFRGEQLIRSLNITEAETFLIHKQYLKQILNILSELKYLKRIVLFDETDFLKNDKIEYLYFNDLPNNGLPERIINSKSDPSMILFTSGSTGFSKPVEISNGYIVGGAKICSNAFQLNEHDVLYCPFPHYHWDLTIGTVATSIINANTSAISERFSVSKFWDEIKFFEATVFDFMGATLSFLYNQRINKSDADNSVRLAWGAPMPSFKKDFEKRFNLKLIEGYGSTEGGIGVFQQMNKKYPIGSCGNVSKEFDLKIVNKKGLSIQNDKIGEIVTKPLSDSTLMMNGYYKSPKLTSKVIKNGWYHTGDLGKIDSKGNLYFSGRQNDVIRRRGENISCIEIEDVIISHSSVFEVAAFGLPSRYTEEDVAVAIVFEHGKKVTKKQIVNYCNDKMAKYMIPEHIFFIDKLPKTPTEKIAKDLLKKSYGS